MLVAPNPTPYDLRFSIAGIPVRVHPLFWLVALLFGWEICQPGFVEYSTGQRTEIAPAVFLALWVAAMFLSILIHELGHVLAFRRYGISSHVVLYHFGGLAIPDGYGFRARIDPISQIVISAAGPAAQLLLAGVILLLVAVAGHALPVRGTLLDRVLPTTGEPIPSVLLHMFLLYLLAPSVSWALMNLLPVYPLDGGQIAQGALEINDPARGVMNAKWLSVFAAAAVAVVGLMWDMKMAAFLFGALAVQNYMEIRGIGGGGGYGGGGYGGGGYGGGRPW